MATERIRIEGIPQLQAALTVAAAVARAASESAVASEVKSVSADARGGAPVQTGELRSGVTGSASGLSGEVRSPVRHSGFVEFGTGKMAAQPFMAPAAEASRRRFPGIAAARIGSGLRRVKG